MHTMHLCFLTERTAYVIVLDSRQDHYLEKTAIDWLQTLKAFAPNSPVILVLNKCDLNRSAMLNLASLKESFPQLVDCIRVSAKLGINISALKNLISYVIRNHTSYSVIFNKKWFGLKERLEEMTIPYISNKEYVDACIVYGIKDASLQSSLLRWFSDLGVTYHYSDFDTHSDMDEINVLNPEWVTNGIYRMILRTTAIDGFIPHEEIYRVMKVSYEDDVHPSIIYSKREVDFILNIMRQKGLSLALNKKELIPLKLDYTMSDVSKKINKKSKRTLHFAIKGDYLPASIIHSLIIQRINEVDFKHMWQRGVLLWNTHMQAEALIELRYESHYRLDIYIQSKDLAVEKEYLSILRTSILAIIERLNIKRYEELICYHLEDGGSGEEPYARVWRPYVLGIKQIYLPSVDRNVSPLTLLNVIYTDEQLKKAGKEVFYVKNIVNNYGSINDSNISFGNQNKQNIEKNLISKLKDIGSENSISEENFSSLLKLLEDMIESKELPAKKHIELVEILHAKEPSKTWFFIKEFLSDTANAMTIASTFPAIAKAICNLFV